MNGLLAAFWAEESDPHVRRLILDEANGKASGATRWEFNTLALTLDFDAGLAVVEDVLSSCESESEDLRTFLDTAAAFADPYSAGDGLTEAQRRPPRYEIDPHGHVGRLDG